MASAIAALALTGCEVSSDSPSGDPAVYERIEATSDCAVLQDEFDAAMTNVESREPGDEFRDISMSYADAAHDRMGDVGCYG